jgi:hypothetical protein
VLIASRGAARMLVHKGNGDGTFTAATAVVTPAAPSAIAAGDFDADGDVDAATANQGVAPSVSILFNGGTGSFTLSHTVALTPTNLLPNDMDAVDLDADGDLDLILSTSASRFVTLVNNGSGGFSIGRVSATQYPISKMAAADLNGDGRPDAAFSMSTQNQVGAAQNRGDGTFGPDAGLAGGDYYMSFNVPNAQSGDADPVLQLRAQYDAWRTGLDGRPDAVQSTVDMPPLYGGQCETLTLSVRDWQGDLVTAPLTFSISPAGASSGLITVGTPVQTAPGTYAAQVCANGVVTDRFRIAIDDGVRRVVLMPDLEVEARLCPADFNADGDVGTDADIEAFFACLAGNCCASCGTADVNGDGDVGTDADIEAFFFSLANGCA